MPLRLAGRCKWYTNEIVWILTKHEGFKVHGLVHDNTPMGSIVHQPIDLVRFYARWGVKGDQTTLLVDVAAQLKEVIKEEQKPCPKIPTGLTDRQVVWELLRHLPDLRSVGKRY